MEKKKSINYGILSGLGFILIGFILFFTARIYSYYFFILGIGILIFSRNEDKIEERKDIKEIKIF